MKASRHVSRNSFYVVVNECRVLANYGPIIIGRWSIPGVSNTVVERHCLDHATIYNRRVCKFLDSYYRYDGPKRRDIATSLVVGYV
jgi:hypothetical protein